MPSGKHKPYEKSYFNDLNNQPFKWNSDFSKPTKEAKKAKRIKQKNKKSKRK